MEKLTNIVGCHIARKVNIIQGFTECGLKATWSVTLGDFCLKKEKMLGSTSRYSGGGLFEEEVDILNKLLRSYFCILKLRIIGVCVCVCGDSRREGSKKGHCEEIVCVQDEGQRLRLKVRILVQEFLGRITAYVKF